MSAPPGRGEGSPNLHFRRLTKPEEFRAVEEVQREAWGLTEEPPVPAPMQRALQDNGGLVIGAFADIYLAGFSLGFLGWDGADLFHYSHMTAVRPEYQNHQVAFRLKSFQRDEVLAAGLPTIRWTFDPLQSKNAYLNVRKLGVRPDRYLVHYYGTMGSSVNRELETDRLRVVWELTSPRVDERMKGTRPTPEADLERVGRAQALLTTETADSGLRVPAAVEDPTKAEATIEIPFDLGLIRQHEPEAVRRWRHATRDAFQAALDVGYAIDDFAVVRLEHEKRAFFLLRRGADGPPGASAARDAG